MTRPERNIEQMLRDLADEPVSARDEFKQHLIATLQQECRPHRQRRTIRQLGKTVLSWTRQRFPQPAIGWAFIAAAFALVLVGTLISHVSPRPLLTVHQGGAQISSRQPAPTRVQKSSEELISITEGDHIALDENSTASLLLFNESKVELLPGTQLTLTTARPRSVLQAQTVYMQVRTGEVQVHVTHLRSERERFEVDLPAALVSVRGTAFRARVVSPQHTYVATDEGVVLVTLHDPAQGNPQVRVPAGHQVDAIVGQPLQVRPQETASRVTGIVDEAQPTAPSAVQPKTGAKTAAENRASDRPLLRDGSPTPPITPTTIISPTRLPIHRPITITPTPKPADTVPTTQTIGRDGPPITYTQPVTPRHTPPPTPVGKPSAPLPVDLDLVQRSTPNPAAADGLLIYHLLITNRGPGRAQDVVVHDILPSQAKMVDATPSVEEDTTPSWNLGTLAAGDRRTIQVTVIVHSWVTQSFTNTAFVTTTTPETRPQNNQAIARTTITDIADLAISAHIPAVAGSGSVVTCTLVYTNQGPATARAITVEERLPPGMTLGGIVSTALYPAPGNTPVGTLQLNGLGPAAWSAPQLRAGASGRIIFTATVDPGILGTLTSTVSITARSPDGNDGNNTDRQILLAVPTADVAIRQHATPNPTAMGGVLTYTLAYTNHGPWPAKNLFVTATLPPSLTLLGWTSPGLITPTRAGPMLTWFTPSLPSGVRGSIVLTGRVDDRATLPLHSQAVIRSDTPDHTLADNRTSRSVDALEPALALASTVKPGRIAPGQPCTYTLRITNTGRITFAAQSIAHPVPPATAPTWTWRNLAPLAPGAHTSVTRVISMARTISPGVHLTTAQVTATVAGRTVTATAPVSVQLAFPSVAASQQIAHDGTGILTSDRVTLTIRLTNTGPSPLALLPLLERHDPRALRLVKSDPIPEETSGNGAPDWTDLTQPSPRGIGRAISSGQTLTVTLNFDVVRPLAIVGPVKNRVTVGELRDIYGNVTAGYTVESTLYRVDQLYLPLVFKR